jgi:hypothetical protein
MNAEKDKRAGVSASITSLRLEHGHLSLGLCGAVYPAVKIAASLRAIQEGRSELLTWMTPFSPDISHPHLVVVERIIIIIIIRSMDNLGSLANSRAGFADADARMTHTKVRLARPDVRFTNANIGLTDADVRFAHANVRLAEPNVGLAHSQVGLPNANIGLANADVRLPNPDVGLSDSKIRLAHANIGLPDADVRLAHTKVVLAEPDMRLAGRWSRCSLRVGVIQPAIAS